MAGRQSEEPRIASDRASAEGPSPHRWKVAGLMLLLAAGIWMGSTFLVAYTDWAFICENTGSHRGHREWFFGLKTKEWYKNSELERFMISAHPQQLQHRWTSYGGTGKSLLPGLTVRGHGRPGAILLLEPSRMDQHVHGLSPGQRLELYQLLSSADRDRIQARIETILFEGNPEFSAENRAPDPLQ